VKIGLSIPISGVGVLNQVDPDMVLGITSDTDGTFTLPLQNATTTITVDWGDASSDVITTYNQAELTHTYASTSTNYDITITGQFGGIKFNNGGDKVRLRNIQNWGSTVWSNCNGAFYDCTAMTITATDLPDTSAATDFTQAWRTCSSLTSFPLIDTSSGTNFTDTWRSCTGLTSFPAINTSAGTIIRNAWQDCTGLAGYDFPVTGFDAMTTGQSQFFGWAMSTSSWEAILVDTEANNQNSTVTLHGGSATYNDPSDGATARAALIADHTWSITDGGAI
jgi:hypothetical protein